MYDKESSIKYEPKYAIDGKTGNGKEIFKSIQEHYPWFAIDFEQPRNVEKIMIKIVEGEKVNIGFFNQTFFWNSLSTVGQKIKKSPGQKTREIK